jgi:ribosomal protein L23
MQDEQSQAKSLGKNNSLPEDKGGTDLQAEKEIVKEKEEAIFQPKPEEVRELEKPKEESLVKETQHKARRRLKKSENQTHKDKVVIMDGQEVLMIPSGFEIMTRSGWKPIMMRADKINKRY